MSNTGRLINYTLRPAKCVERKVMCELLSKFNTSTPIHQYRYIGFGAFYFSDFVLFHNNLNINKMISIERSSNIDRYEFNKPYNCIEMVYDSYGHAISSSIEFSEDIKDIIWLDYDSNFTEDVLNDSILTVGKISSGSFMFVSFNTSIPEDQKSKKLPYLDMYFHDYLPAKLEEKDISKKSLPSLLFTILNTAIQKAMLARSIKEKTNMTATPIFFVKYSDNAEMITIGYHIDYENNVDYSAIQDSPWYNLSGSPQSINVPCFTKAEIREINRLLPGSTSDEIHSKLPYLAKSDIEKYIGLYKYYPNFLDSLYYV